MKKILTSFFLCSFLLSACDQDNSLNKILSEKKSVNIMKEEIALDFIPRTYTIVSVGDSLTQGVGDSTKRGGYLPYLEELLEGEKSIQDAQIFNFGVSGNRTTQLLNKLKTVEVKDALRKADIVMITIGGNDVMKVVRENFIGLELKDFDRELINYEKSLTSVVETIRRENQDAMIGLIGLYNPFYQYFEDVEEMDVVMQKWNDVSRLVIGKYENTLFVDIADVFQESEENLLYKDYFHPNDKGYELIAEQAYTVLQESALDILSASKYLASKKEEQNE